MSEAPPDVSQARERLRHWLTELSVKIGRFTLASGKVSDFYVDCKQTALHAEGAHCIGTLVYDHVQKLRRGGTRVVGVGGLSLGADPIAVATAVVSVAHRDPVHAFIIRKEPKGHGTGAWIEGARNLSAGAKVLIVEDVVTSGGSTQKAVERARQSGLSPVAILTLVDRQEGGRENLASLGLPFASLLTRADFESLSRS